VSPRRQVAVALIAATTMVAAAALAVTALQRGGAPAGDGSRSAGARHDDGTPIATDAAGLGPPAQPAFTVATPRPLRVSRGVARWAPVLRPAVARARPQPYTPVVARIPTRTPEGTTNILLVIGAHRDGTGGLWVQVRLPILPNNTTGWVRRSALGGYRFVRTRLVVDLRSLEATLYRGRATLLHVPVGVGTKATPTPVGRFYIRDRLTRYASPFYGPIAFGTSARSPVLTDWPAGGYVGIHGTNEPGLIPGRVSHGCIRLRNADILELARLMPIGTPVTITPRPPSSSSTSKP
jgi:lipoprotein-anchoring transpeptidase ErfK/SrfK